jgi:ABC-type branched-subunit amino acid transport system ATPase component
MSYFECKKLVKNFGGLNAIDRLDIHVDKGEIVSIIGPNGAGKTTVFNVITGFNEPTSGEINFRGQSLLGLRPDQITELGIARTYQNVRLFLNMTILENVMVGQHSRTGSGVVGAILRTASYRTEQTRVVEIAKEQLAFFGSRLVGYRMEQLAMMLSYANRRRLEIARAMATEASILLLDEPTAGMNPMETLEMAEIIRRLRDERGFTIIVIEHDMKVVKGISDRVIVMDYGKKITEGDYDSVANDERVIEAYLGRVSRDSGNGRG